MDPDQGHKHFLISLTKEEFKILFHFFRFFFHANTLYTLKRFVIISLLSAVTFGLIFFCRFLILTLRSGSEDPHNFADPDPESKNVADPTDPDPKLYLRFIIYKFISFCFFKLSI